MVTFTIGKARLLFQPDNLSVGTQYRYFNPSTDNRIGIKVYAKTFGGIRIGKITAADVKEFGIIEIDGKATFLTDVQWVILN